MPIYEFKCGKCGKEFERVVFGSDTDEITCPDCDSSETRRLMSVFACSGIEKELSSGCSGGGSGFS
jgi:putative FmdB family regulatory protein